MDIKIIRIWGEVVRTKLLFLVTGPILGPLLDAACLNSLCLSAGCGALHLPFQMRKVQNGSVSCLGTLSRLMSGEVMCIALVQQSICMWQTWK